MEKLRFVWKGVPNYELSREDLLDIIEEQAETQKNDSNTYLEQLKEFMKICNSITRR